MTAAATAGATATAAAGEAATAAQQQRDAAMSAALGTIYGATVALIIWWLFLDED